MACACGNTLRYGDELTSGFCRDCDDDFNDDLSDLTDAIEDTIMNQEPITSFTGDYRWLSNFWDSPIDLGNGLHARTVEHAYQALKAVTGIDVMTILGASTPAAAKRLGRNIRIRSDWEEIKDLVMGSLLVAKFGHPHLREKLIATGSRELIEGNTWGDTYWGVCKGKGENHLGKLLMALRTVIQEEGNTNAFLAAGE